MRSKLIVSLASAAAGLAMLAAAGTASASVTPNVTAQCASVSGGACLSLVNKLTGKAADVQTGSRAPGSQVEGRLYSSGFSNEDLTNANTGASEPWETVAEFDAANPGVLSTFVASHWAGAIILSNEFTPLGHGTSEYLTWVPNHGVQLQGNPDSPRALWIIPGNGLVISAASTNANAPEVLTMAAGPYTTGPHAGFNRIYVEGQSHPSGPHSVADAQNWKALFGSGPLSR